MSETCVEVTLCRTRGPVQKACLFGALSGRAQLRSTQQTARTPTLHLLPRETEVMGKLVLGHVRPQATQPASTQPAYLAVTLCSLSGTGEARGDCGVGYPGGPHTAAAEAWSPAGGAGEATWRGHWSHGVDGPSTASQLTSRFLLRSEPGVGHYLGDHVTREPLHPNFCSNLVVPG